jgi:hypothetical protein
MSTGGRRGVFKNTDSYSQDLRFKLRPENWLIFLWLSLFSSVSQHIGYWWEIQKERDHWEDQDVGGWTILKLILDRMGWWGLDRSGSG